MTEKERRGEWEGRKGGKTERGKDKRGRRGGQGRP